MLRESQMLRALGRERGSPRHRSVGEDPSSSAMGQFSVKRVQGAHVRVRLKGDPHPGRAARAAPCSLPGEPNPTGRGCIPPTPVPTRASNVETHQRHPGGAPRAPGWAQEGAVTTGTHHGGPGTRACSRSVLQEQPLGAASAPLAPLTRPQLPRERGVPPAASPAPAWPQPLSPRGTRAGKPGG